MLQRSEDMLQKVESMSQKERTVERRKTESEAAPPLAGPSQDEGELTFLRTKAEKEYG